MRAGNRGNLGRWPRSAGHPRAERTRLRRRRRRVHRLVRRAIAAVAATHTRRPEPAAGPSRVLPRVLRGWSALSRLVAGWWPGPRRSDCRYICHRPRRGPRSALAGWRDGVLPGDVLAARIAAWCHDATGWRSGPRTRRRNLTPSAHPAGGADQGSELRRLRTDMRSRLPPLGVHDRRHAREGVWGVNELAGCRNRQLPLMFTVLAVMKSPLGAFGLRPGQMQI